MLPFLDAFLGCLIWLSPGPLPQGPGVGGPPVRHLPGGRSLAAVHELLPTEHDTTNEDVTATAAADLDGDGDLDLVLGLCLLGDWGNEALVNVVLLNQGGGRFVEGQGAFPYLPDIPRDIGSADVDGDGDLDLLVTNDNSFTGSPGPDHLYRNLGGARFVNASAQLVPGSDRGLVRFGDVDGDGDADLLHPSTSTGLVELHRNQGTGTFVDASGSLPSRPGFADGRFGDVDVDGDLDVLLSSPSKTALWLDDGTGALTDASAGRVPLTQGAERFELGDLDGDMDLDFGSFARVLLNDGSGAFTNMAVPAGFWPPLALADVDGDHDLDLFGPTRMLLNDGLARFTDASIRLPIQQDEVGAFAAGDLDADGDVDALAAEYGTYFGALPRRAEFLLLNDGSSFTDSRALPDAFTRPMVAASSMGRLDGDAFTDLVLDAYDGPLQLLPGDGTGRFGSPVNLPRPAGSVHALRIARVDPDGANDLVLAADNGVKVLYGPALGLTATPIATETRGIAHGDLDGDGDVDLVTSEVAPANNRLLLQGPPRSFTLASAASFPKLPGAPSAVDVLDADSDGDLDVVFAQATVKLYLNRGLATFVDVSATHVPGGAATSVAAGDVDGDGATDLVAGSSTDQRLLLNLGDGHFVPRPDLLDSALPSQLGHLLVDSDRDGDLDLLHGTWGPLYTNDGRGSFGQPRSVGFVSQPVAADVDGDGDLDVLAVGNGQEDYAGGRILRNHGLQLTWLSLPSVGEPLVLEISGPPLEPFVLAAAPARGTTATPYGTLWLDPGSAKIVGRGHLDVPGRKRCTFAIPPTPALIGATRYWQALVGRPPRLTNLEATTFTDL